jgi:hypothetical protein
MHHGSSAAAPSGRWTAIVDAIGASQAVAGSGVTDSGGMLGVVWPGHEFIERHKCMDPEVVHVRSDKDWSEDAQLKFLTEVFGKICDSFAIDRLPPERVADMAS